MATGSGTPVTGVYAFQIRFNFLRHPGGKGTVDAGEGALPAYSIKWKRGAKKENKGVIGPNPKKSAAGDYVFNTVIELESTLKRKNAADLDKGWEFKWFEIEVFEHYLDDKGVEKRKALFDAEYNLASALPPQRDISPHLLLQRAGNDTEECSLSLSIGYRMLRKIEGERSGLGKVFVCGAPTGVSAHEKKTNHSNKEGVEEKEGSQPWWRCGDLNAANPEKPEKETKRSASEGGGGTEWWRCGGTAASAPPVQERPPHRDADEAESTAGGDRRVQFNSEVDMKYLNSAGSIVSDGDGDGPGNAPSASAHSDPNTNDDEEEEEVLFIRDEQNNSNSTLADSARGGIAPSVVSSTGTLPLTAHLYTRRSSGGARDKGFLRSTQLPMAKPSPKKRPSRLGNPVKSLRLKRGGDLEEAAAEPEMQNLETVCNKQVFYHEVDVRALKRGPATGSCDDSVAAHARQLLGSPDHFSPISAIVGVADHTTAGVELGEMSIPRAFTLLWGYHTDFPSTVHLSLKHKNFKASKWDINDDNPNYLKWCGAQYNTWTQTEKKIIGDKVSIVEDLYFVTFKFGDSPSCLYVHSSQRPKKNDKGPRVETVYKFSTNKKGLMEMDISSKLMGVDLQKLSGRTRKSLKRNIEKTHEALAMRAVQKTQIYLMRRSIRPSLAVSKRTKRFGPTGEKKKAQITLNTRQCRERLRRHGASMGTLGIITLGGRTRGLSHIKVRNLDSYFGSTGDVKKEAEKGAEPDPSAPEGGAGGGGGESPNPPKRCRISDLPWKELGNINTIVHESLCLMKVNSIHERLKGFTTGDVQREGFSQGQVQTVVRVLAAYPNNNPEGGVLEGCFGIMQVMCSSSLVVLLETPNAVDTISAAWKCCGMRCEGLRKYKPLVESLQRYHGKREDAAKESAASKTLLKHYNITEDVLERFNCSLVVSKGVSSRGTLYITRSWLCFSASSRHVMISTFDITKVSVKKWLLGSTIFVHAENRCVDALDFNNPHKESQVFEFSVLFKGKVERAIMSVVRGGGRPRVRLSQQFDATVK